MVGVGPTGLPSRRQLGAMMPGSGLVPSPAWQRRAPGSGVIMMAPVSVCHQVSTIGAALAADHRDTTSRLRD